MEDFNYQLKHIPGAQNWADALSRRPDHDDGSDNNNQVVALLDEVFVKAITVTTLDGEIRQRQWRDQTRIESWKDRYHLMARSDGVWYKGKALVVTGEDETHWVLLEVYHDSLTAGHSRVVKTLIAVAQEYWWLDNWRFMQEYVKGCSKCQESKTNTHPNRLPLQPITPNSNAQPFSMITVDFIVKLPILKGYDSICTIIDHNCTKAVILLPCWEEMSFLNVARLYLERVFPFVGLPDKVISDRDSKFTSKVFREVCKLLEVKQKMASTYHPQTDGQSEKTNQHVEMALRIFGNFRQDDWSNLLPVIQYQINS